MKRRLSLYLLFLLLSFTGHTQYQYIHEVLEYTPAPGQFVNKAPMGLPESAESITGTITGALSLGAWGGYVVFRFEEPVQNHPDNPFGIDFIIFGNPLETWSEPAIVWVMQDENSNGMPDDTWYQLAGSDYFFSSTLHNYQVTYFNPQSETAAEVPWEDNLGHSGFILTNGAHTQPYYPSHEIFPQIAHEQYTLQGTRILGKVENDNPAFIKSYRRAFGYADNLPRATSPFNVPDNPYTPEIENAGGDGFDINWAIDANGSYTDLDEIHFIKVQTAMPDHGGWLGEVSTEITGAIVVAPNPDISGILDMVVAKDLPRVITQSPYPVEAFSFHKGRLQPDRTILWTSDQEGAFVDEEGFLHFNVSGELTLTAYWEENPDIFTTVTTTLDYNPTHTPEPKMHKTRVYPLPADDHITIETDREAIFILYDMQGAKLMEFTHSGGTMRFDTSTLMPGLYLLTSTDGRESFNQKIVIR
ncbi:MAG: T9SS type A sorting domain-containing protein [Bacteroidota bacterium]